MISYLQSIKAKLKYSGIVRLFLDAFGRIGVQITPYYIVMEGLFEDLKPYLGTGFEAYDVGFLGHDDMQAIAAIPGRNISEVELIERLENGNLCFGLKLNGDLGAFTWCHLAEYRGLGRIKPLAQDEAYLFDAYTLFPYRGKGIAPYIRYQLYKELAKLGKHKLYSYSDAFNASSLNFKKKLNAKITEKHLSIDIFRRWQLNFLIRKYN